MRVITSSRSLAGRSITLDSEPEEEYREVGLRTGEPGMTEMARDQRGKQEQLATTTDVDRIEPRTFGLVAGLGVGAGIL
jgi:hypothetical protein